MKLNFLSPTTLFIDPPGFGEVEEVLSWGQGEWREWEVFALEE